MSNPLADIKMGEENNIPKKCRSCLNFSGSHCEVHQYLIEDAANCSEWTEMDCPEEDMHISVAKLREVLEEMAGGFDEPIIYNAKVEDIIEQIKKLI